MIDRRAFLTTASVAAMAPALLAAAADGKRIAALFAGQIDDKGFMQSGYSALELARDKLGAGIDFIQGVRPEQELLAGALRTLANKRPDLVVAHGGQNNAAAQQVAAEFPAIPFVVTQGGVKGANLSSYEVLQEHSAFLAGALAALATRTGVVGHMSGIRVTPGLKGRAAFVAGVKHVAPAVTVLTNFSGNQDDNPLSYKVASAMIAQKADIIFTMLNAGRTGVTDACRERRAHQIGNVVDWTLIAPDVFIASAVANSGLGLFHAASDIATGAFRPGVIRQIGLEQPDAVRLAVAPSIDSPIAAKVRLLAGEILGGKLEVPTTYDGVEFATPA